MKKFIMVLMLLGVFAFSVFGATTGVLQVSGTIASSLSLTVSESAYTLLSAGASTKATMSSMLVKSNSKTSFTITVSTTNTAVNGSFVAKATVIGSAQGAVVNWPYKLFLDDSVGGTNVELTPAAPAKSFLRKTVAQGDTFALQTTYESAETLNLDAGTYSDTITVTLTSN